MSTADFAAKMNKRLGGDFVVQASQLIVPRRYTSGSLTWDSTLGGGYPANQWTEVIGPASAGKTATTYKCIAANQKADSNFEVLWVAGEHFDKEQAAALGVDLNRTTVVSTQLMEQAFDAMILGTESREFDCIVLDSYPALTTGEEAEKTMEEFTVATGAKLMNKFIRKANLASARALDGSERPFFGIIINQWRDQIGGFSPRGTPKITPGGKGKDYFFYTRIELSRDGDFLTEKRPGEGDVKVGQTIKMKTIKNKSAAPQQIATVDYYFTDAPSQGFSRGDYNVAKEYATIGISLGIIQRSGAWYKYSGQQFQGLAGLTSALREDSLLREVLRSHVLEASTDTSELGQVEAR
jgi:recombination protein RecA